MSDHAEAARAEAEAARWFETLRQTSVSGEALREFHAWRADGANEAAFRRVEAGWKATGSLAKNPEVQAATAALLARGVRRGTVTWRPLAPTLAMGGLVLALLGTWGFGALFPAYATRLGEQRVVVLSDGSRVRLNTDSAVRIWFWNGTRRVQLAKGQAFFDVAHDASRPFVVEAGAAKVRALGTRFDVRRNADAVSVTLLEGRVRVTAGSGAAELRPDQQLVASRIGVSAPRSTSASDEASWTTGRLVFRGLPIRAAVAEANRYSAVKIVLAVPPGLAEDQVSGTFEAGDIEAVAAALAQTYGLEANRPSPDVIRLTPRSDGS